MKVIVYTKPNCVKCDTTKRALRKFGVEYESRSVMRAGEPTEHMDEMMPWTETCGRTMPIVVVYDDEGQAIDAWGDYRRSKIEALADG